MVRKGVPRAPHKEGCMCIICKAKRAKATLQEVVVPAPVVAPPPPPAPSVILAGSLKQNEKFEFGGQSYRAGRGEKGIVIGLNISSPGSAPLSLGLNAKVKRIK